MACAALILLLTSTAGSSAPVAWVSGTQPVVSRGVAPGPRVGRVWTLVAGSLHLRQADVQHQGLWASVISSLELPPAATEEESTFNIRTQAEQRGATQAQKRSGRVVELTDWLSESDGAVTPADVNWRRNATVRTAAIGQLATVRSKSLPYKIQQEMALLWHEMEAGDRLSYLGEYQVARIRQALVSLAAFKALLEHPNQVLHRRTAASVFRAADVNGDGRLSFAEFQRWYDSSQAEPGRSGGKGTGLVLANRAKERLGVADMLREWLASGKEEEEEDTAQEESQKERAFEQLDRAIETTQLLLELKADAESVLAALSRAVLKVEDGDTDVKMEVIKEQCGPIVHRIVAESTKLKGALRGPVTSASAGLDLDHQNAKLAREYLIRANGDARAFVVHMASLVYELRNQYRLPLHQRHVLALESLQLYVPMANALGLGRGFSELEDLSYRALFPSTYDKFSGWHRTLADLGQVALVTARDRISQSIENHLALRSQLLTYDIQGRVKSALSAFKKVFRQDKSPSELHDLLGLRIILSLRPLTALLASSTRSQSHSLPPREDTGRGHADDPSVWNAEGHSSTAVTMTSAGALAVMGQTEAERESRVCHEVHRLITDMWDELPGRYKNYVDNPKKNGYQSVHTGVVLVGGAVAEIQIRTDRMHQIAEHGIAAHALYKGEVSTPEAVAAFQQHTHTLARAREKPLLLPDGSTSEGEEMVAGREGIEQESDAQLSQKDAPPP